jgi:hypothetical protein
MLRHWHSRADARRKRGAELGSDDDQPFPTVKMRKSHGFPTRKPYTNRALSTVTKDYSVSLLHKPCATGKGPKCQESPTVPQGPKTNMTTMDWRQTVHDGTLR